MLRLNTLSPAPGSKTKARRLGRGIGSGLGKTCGKGHKGQKARAGGYHKVGFEGGQIPLQRRLPKFGFKSRTAQYATEINLDDLERLNVNVVDLVLLKDANLINHRIKRVKVVATGSLTRAVTLRGLQVSAGAKVAIESVNGVIEGL